MSLLHDADKLARQIHAGQRRKGDGSDYYSSHLLVVRAHLAEVGCGEFIQALGLLHDAIEDHGTLATLAAIDALDPMMLALLWELTEDKSLSWTLRKQQTVLGISKMSPETACVKAADFLSNLRGFMRGDKNPGFWEMFNASREEILGYHRNAVLELHYRGDMPEEMMTELDMLIKYLMGEEA